MKNSDVDRWIAEATEASSPGSAAAVTAHCKLTKIFESITELKKRSLASKYLHFHSPSVFFIYDSRAAQVISEVAPALSKISDIQTCASEFDAQYKDFTRRCIWLREDIRREHNVQLTPRQIDKLLLKIAADALG